MLLEHVNLTVRDVARATSFYSELLGLHTRWQGVATDGRKLAHVGDDRSYLALFEAGSDSPVENDYLRLGFNHVGFVVADLDAARGHLQTLGATAITEIDDYEPGRRLYFNDLDGIEVELVEYRTAQ